MSKWNLPKEVSDLDLGFGPKNLEEYLPAMSEIPEEFREQRGEAKKWIQVVDDWFFSGIHNLVATPKVGVDKKTAMRHLKTILSSYDPQHEHKTAGVAWLLSQWFHVFDYQVSKVKNE